jgi:hypothetical protein
MFPMWWRLVLLGAIGTASLMLAPLERLIPVPIDPLALRAVSMIQPAVLMMLMAALGLWAAPKVGLDAPVVRAWAEGRSLWPALQPQLVPAVLGGLAVAAVLVAFASYLQTQPAAAPLLTPRNAAAHAAALWRLRRGADAALGHPVALRVAGSWRAGGARRTGPVLVRIWAGLTVAALLFAVVGHLPTAHMLLPDPPAWLTGLIVATNALPGLLFGWLFWRRGLEAAMGAHALAHLFAWVALAIV